MNNVRIEISLFLLLQNKKFFFLETGRKSKFDKTVRREICQITTPGTKTFNTLDNDNVFRESLYLLSIVEIVCLFKLNLKKNQFDFFSQLLIIKSHHVNSVYVSLIQQLHNFMYDKKKYFLFFKFVYIRLDNLKMIDIYHVYKLYLLNIHLHK